jgi:hypothetical protein
MGKKKGMTPINGEVAANDVCAIDLPESRVIDCPHVVENVIR